MEIIRNLAPSQCSNLPSNLLVDGTIYDSHIDIANLFNAYFVNIASSVVLNKNESTTPNWDYLKGLVRSKLPLGASFTILPITSVFVLNSLRHLPTGKAVDLDGLSRYFLKLSAPSIASSLTTIFNLSLSLGSFPDLLKRLKYHLYLKTVLYLTALIIDRFLFLLLSLRFLNVMFAIHFITFLLKMTSLLRACCYWSYWSPSQQYGQQNSKYH